MYPDLGSRKTPAPGPGDGAKEGTGAVLRSCGGDRPWMYCLKHGNGKFHHSWCSHWHLHLHGISQLAMFDYRRVYGIRIYRWISCETSVFVGYSPAGHGCLPGVGQQPLILVKTIEEHDFSSVFFRPCQALTDHATQCGWHGGLVVWDGETCWTQQSALFCETSTSSIP